MSIKRQATSELNHDNWDQEDPAEDNEMGNFKAASRDVIEKRVIRTAKRRAPISNDETKRSVFQNTKFGNFNKPAPSSFDFLANLTNQSKSTNGSSDTVSSSLFSPKQAAPSGGLFSNSTTKATASSLSTSPFGSAKTSSLFTASKADSTVNESPFKMQPVSSTGDSQHAKSPSQISSNLFGVSSSSNDNKQLFAATNSSPFKMQAVSSTSTTMVQTTFGITTNPATPMITPDKKDEEKPNENKMKYYAKLKGLNESVSDWISKHVAQTPLCILSPIFKDYDKYLKEIMDEYQEAEKGDTKVTENTPAKIGEKVTETKTSSVFGASNAGSSLFSNTSATKPAFGASNSNESSDNKASNFSFGMKSPSAPNATTTSTGFSFGVTSVAASTATSTFSLTTSSPQNSTPFSFGIGKPFSFSPTNIQQNSEPKQATTEDNEDEPPKVEYTPVKEDNSVYEKTCKVFVKKDGNFADKGVGTLYVKKIEESGKHQLLVRANTNLGTILLNLILSSSVPMQRAGKNNVMLVCIPTSDVKPPPTPVLIRVKTGEDADELLETLKKHTA